MPPVLPRAVDDIGRHIVPATRRVRLAIPGEGVHEKEEGNEVKIKFAEAPAAVQATLTREANGAAIADVDKESDDGKDIYEADAMISGKNYEIKVAADGSLVSKKLDAEEGSEKAGEKDEKGEKKD